MMIVDDLCPDYKLLDSWTLNIDGAFDEVFTFIITFDPSRIGWTVASLFKIRKFIGRIFKWDTELKSDQPSLVQPRMNAELKARDRSDSFPMTSKMGPKLVYVIDEEGLLEINNKTALALIHMSKQNDATQMRVYVKPTSRWTWVYLAAIKPARHLIVYPAWIKALERNWKLEKEGKL